MNDRSQLIRVFQYGSIRVLPGIVGLLIIPWLVRSLGTDEYGKFSLLQGYVFLASTVVGALVTQPMYRFLSSNKEMRAKYNLYSLFSGITAAVLTAVILLPLNDDLGITIAFSIAAMAAVLFATVTVQMQILERISSFAYIEIMRVTIFFGLCIYPPIASSTISLSQVSFAFLASYIFPLMVYSSYLFPFEKIDKKWLKQPFEYGLKSAGWLLLAGLPIIISKTVLSVWGTSEELGEFSAAIDFIYRAFSIINAAIVMTVFPVLSRLFDQKEYRKTRKTIEHALALYLVLGALFSLLVVSWAYFSPQATGGATVSFLDLATIVIACFVWAAMSIAHKPYELALRTTTMVVLMAAAVVIFLVVSILCWLQFSITLSSSLAIGMIFAGSTYCIIAYRSRLRLGAQSWITSKKND